MQLFDLIVIGTGAAGAGAAKKCAQEGWNVAILDFRPFGGTCPLRGCDPKKILAGVADIIDQNQRMRGKGIASKATIDWQDLMDFKKLFTKPIPEATVDDFENLGIRSFHGEASFTDEQTLEVNGEKLRGDHILIATGNKPAPLPIDGFDHLVTSGEFLELNSLPGKIIFVGGGYISFEFAHIAARAGAEVTILHQLDKPLKDFDSDMVNILSKKTKELGISIHLNAEVKSVKQTNDGFQTTAQHDGKQLTFTSDLVVHGAGRVPEIDKLNLQQGNVAAGDQGINVNDYLQSTSNEHVYAAGDAAASKGLPLTPLAGFESNIVTQNLLEGNHQKADYPAQPTVVFTTPTLAAVGYTEQEARDAGFNTRINFQRTDDWYASRRTNESHTAYKSIMDNDTQKILGAHLLGDHSAELINLFALAMNQDLTTDDLKRMLYAYPTHASNIAAMV